MPSQTRPSAIAHRQLRRAWLLATLIAATAPRAGSQEPLSTALAVRSLTPEQAANELPVALTASVTFVDEGQTIFIQDATAGTFFQIRPQHPAVLPGDRVSVQGSTFPGLYIPGIRDAHIEIFGRGPMPEPQQVTPDDLTSGRYHYQRVRVRGRILQIHTLSESESTFRLATGNRRLEVHVDAPVTHPDQWLDAEVDVVGLAAGEINNRRQIVSAYLRISRWEDLRRLAPPAPPEQLPIATAATLLTTVSASHPGSPLRVRFSGIVLGPLQPGSYALRDLNPPESGASAAEVRFRTADTLAVGHRVDAVGYPLMMNFSAGLDATEAITIESGPPPLPIVAPLTELRHRDLDAELLTVEGVMDQPYRSRNGLEWTLREGNDALAITVRGPISRATPAAGSRVQVTGLLRVDTAIGRGFNARPDTLRLLLRSEADWHLLRPPPWWTPQRLLVALIALAALASAAILWVTSLRRQVAKQADALKTRIASEATLEERQRIAREFHDTLEQELAGLSLRLDAAKSRPLDPKAAALIVTSRHLVSRLQAEARNFVADLRSDAQSPADLIAALNDLVCRQVDHGLNLQWLPPPQFPPLPGITVHHLRMMAQEALTNVQKHARAQNAELSVEIRDHSLSLSVTDDGVGITEPCASPGHFGCMGIRERARKIGASVAWTAEPAGGTRVHISLPLPP